MKSNVIREVFPSIFGLHYCRICDQRYELEDMHEVVVGCCKFCGDMIEHGYIDNQGRKTNE